MTRQGPRRKAESQGPTMFPNTIRGNASEQIKSTLANYHAYRGLEHTTDPDIDAVFGKRIQTSLNIIEISILNDPDEPHRHQARVVFEIEISAGMVNEVGILHGGCSAYLVDITSAYALSALGLHLTGQIHVGISLLLNVIYHSPALKGERLQIISRTNNLDGEAASARTEIWNATQHRLVASGVHSKMNPSQAKAKL